MDFYDSIFQYDLEIENKIMKRLDKFLKLVNILKYIVYVDGRL